MNKIEYIPADFKNVEPPKLKITEDIILLNFRNFYWTDSHHTLNGSNPGQVLTENPNLIPVEIVNSILTGLDVPQQEFTEDDIRKIEEWHEASLAFYK